jgi:hypothetical protein
MGVTGPTRDPNAPEAPAFDESGFPGFESSGLVWLVDVLQGCPGRSWEDQTRRGASHATVLRRIAGVNSVLVGNAPEEFRKVMKSNFDIYGQVLSSSPKQ